MARKTVDLDLLVESCNRALAVGDDVLTQTGRYGADDAKSYRFGIIAVIEQALMMATRYKGFSYQESELGADGTLRVGYDETRRVYTL